MSQNRQQYPCADAAFQSLSTIQADDARAEVDTLKIVACSTCRAIYVPMGTELAQNSTLALEAAFQDVCRFCFRCQRSACPQCWNPMHHVCASCGEEARLPFRSPVPSLEGLVFLPPSSVQPNQASKISFICQRNGRFYIPEPVLDHSRPHKDAFAPLSAAEEPVISDALPVLPGNYEDLTPTARQSSPYPTWLQEILGQHADETATHAGEEVVIKTSTNSYPLVEPAIIWSHTNQSSWSPVLQNTYPQAEPIHSHMMPAMQVPPEPAMSAILTLQPLAPASSTFTIESQSEVLQLDDTANEEYSAFERVENALIAITSALLLIVVLMIVLSISFVQVNTFFLNLLRIDVRSEIAYLLQLR
ncbi:MAG TPA: hypothetical protein VGD98_08245 [Ktedonobacteraceae bacterium]